MRWYIVLLRGLQTTWDVGVRNDGAEQNRARSAWNGWLGIRQLLLSSL